MTDRRNSETTDIATNPFGRRRPERTPRESAESAVSAEPVANDHHHLVRTVSAALSAHLRRPPRVLDLSRRPNPGIHARVSQPASGVSEGLDLVICPTADTHENPHTRDTALDIAVGYADTAGVVLFETVWGERTAGYWDEPPDDLKRLRRSFAFVHTVMEGDADGRRPVTLFCSNRYIYADGHLDAFTSWTPYSREMAGDRHRGTRRYFFSADKVAKCFCFWGVPARKNRHDLETERLFLSQPPIKDKSVPRVVAHHFGSHGGVLIVERLPGISLSTAIIQGRDYDDDRVLCGVLDRLDALERVGLYHNDIELWNILIDDEGGSTLIDFASITPERRPAWMPYDSVTAFFLFVRKLSSRRMPPPSAGLLPFLSDRFPRRYRRWAALVWTYPEDQRSYALLKKCLMQTGNAPRILQRRGGIRAKIERPYRFLSYLTALFSLQTRYIKARVRSGKFL